MEDKTFTPTVKYTFILSGQSLNFKSANTFRVHFLFITLMQLTLLSLVGSADSTLFYVKLVVAFQMVMHKKHQNLQPLQQANIDVVSTSY